MPRKKRGSSVVTRKNVLPIIDLSEDSSNSTIATREAHQELFDNDNTLPDSEDYLPNDDECYLNDLNSEDDDDSVVHFNNKRKHDKDMEKEKDAQKKSRKFNN